MWLLARLGLRKLALGSIRLPDLSLLGLGLLLGTGHERGL